MTAFELIRKKQYEQGQKQARERNFKRSSHRCQYCGRLFYWRYTPEGVPLKVNLNGSPHHCWQGKRAHEVSR
jgi:hypothetical protein